MSNLIKICYDFEIQGKDPIFYEVVIDQDSYISKINNPQNRPEWTKLAFCQCEGCSWKQDNICPVAARIAEPVKLFNNILSHEKAKITVYTKRRTIQKETDVQTGLSSLLGLIIATSGCPFTTAFRPMARTHLPFADFEETIYRVLSNQLCHLYFHDDLELPRKQITDKITKSYEKISTVNKRLSQRIQTSEASSSDTPFNAVAILDSFALMFEISLEDGLKEIESFFTDNS